MRLSISAKTDWRFISVACGSLLIIVAGLGGIIPKFFRGEEFYVFQYASSLSHLEALQLFFYKNSRLVEGIFWTYQYKFIGYNPELAHSISIALNLAVTIIATAFFLNAWPHVKRHKEIPYLFVLLIFFNWISNSSIFAVSYDNSRLALLFFFLAGLALQKWATAERARWLLLSYLFFLISLLTYENSAFLFPALLLLTWPQMPEHIRGTFRNKVKYGVGLTVVSGIIMLIPSWVYSQTKRSGFFEFSEMPSNLVEAGPRIYFYFGQIFKKGLPFNSIVAASLVVILALSTYWIYRLLQKNASRKSAGFGLHWLNIYLASLWFLVFGPLPYVLLGYDVGGRIYSSAVFGVFLLLMLIYDISSHSLTKFVAVTIIVFFTAAGLFMISWHSEKVNNGEVSLNIFYRGLISVVPHVRPHTGFIIINGPVDPVDPPSCAPSLIMLYNQFDLECVTLQSNNIENQAIRHPMNFEANGLLMRGPNWILIKVENDVPILIEVLNPGDLDLQISWKTLEPLYTNNGRIIKKDLPVPSEFFINLLQRAKELELLPGT